MYGYILNRYIELYRHTALLPVGKRHCCSSYLERVYSLRPLCSRIAVNVPIQPRSR